jgi:glycine/D-amino acid oxidase-like deaminating enzyme
MRPDDRYTIGSGTESVIDIVPRSFQYARAFLPAFISEWRNLSFRLGREFVDELKVPRRWKMDEVTPFEKVRVLDPRPSPKGVLQALGDAQRVFPALGKANVEQVWGGYLDVTPDAIPIISGVDEIPGFYIATGFSGHGFGIAPGAGRLMADIVTGGAPIVSPEAFRFSRFK